MATSIVNSVQLYNASTDLMTRRLGSKQLTCSPLNTDMVKFGYKKKPAKTIAAAATGAPPSPKMKAAPANTKTSEILKKHLERCLGDDRAVIRVAYEGIAGEYAHAALNELPLSDKLNSNSYVAEKVPCLEPEAVFRAVESWAADMALIPIQNSLDGSFHRNYDLLLRHAAHVQIVGELQRCHVEPECSESESVTRFLQLARSPPLNLETPYEFGSKSGGGKTAYKTTVAFALEPSLLARALSAFAFRNVDVVNLESRPMPAAAKFGGDLRRSSGSRTADCFEYVFFVDVDSHVAEPAVQKALKQVQEISSLFKILGCYPVLSC